MCFGTRAGWESRGQGFFLPWEGSPLRQSLEMMGRGRGGGWVCVAKAEIDREQGDEVRWVRAACEGGLTSLAPQRLAHDRWVLQ